MLVHAWWSRLLIIACVVASLGRNPVVAQSMITPLGDLPGGPYTSYGYDVSADGSVVAGSSFSTEGRQGFRWTNSEGMMGLGFLNGQPFFSQAFAISSDGQVIVGGSASLGQEAFRWDATNGMIGIGTLPGFSSSAANDVSDGGSVIVGWSASTLGVYEAFRWTAAGGMVGLGAIAGEGSYAHGVTNDGHVVVGWSNSSNGENEAFRWSEAAGMQGLGDLPGGEFSSRAVAVSADGSVIVGRGSTAGATTEAFRWTASGGMKGLGKLAGGTRDSTATAVSADGSVIVGQAITPNGAVAFRWDESRGMVPIRTLLSEAGVDMQGWQLTSASGISSNGEIIVGFGVSPLGLQEAWLARLVPVPEPAGLLQVAGASLVLVRRRRIRT